MAWVTARHMTQVPSFVLRDRRDSCPSSMVRYQSSTCGSQTSGKNYICYYFVHKLWNQHCVSLRLALQRSTNRLVLNEHIILAAFSHLQAAINNCPIKFRLLPICVVLVFQYCTASSSWGNKENTWVHTDIYRNCQHAVNVSPLKRSSSGGHTDGWEAETVCSCHSVPGPTSCVCVHEEGGGGTTLDVSCQRKN